MTKTRKNQELPRRIRTKPTPHVPIRTGTCKFDEWEVGKRFAGRDLFVSRMAGAEQVHVNVTVVPAGKQSCPFHYHIEEEEHFYVLAGRCVLRSGQRRFRMEAGDYVCFLAGSGVAHAFENPFDEDCRLLAIGPRSPSEVIVYPDSGKVKLRATETILQLPQLSVDYWDGEPVGVPLGRDDARRVGRRR